MFGIYGVTVLGHEFSLPVGGWNGGALANMVLPVTVLALPQIAMVSRLMRGSMVEVLRANYIRTARAKGLPVARIVMRHALRAAVLPLVSYLGPALAGRPHRLAGRGADLRPAGHRPLFHPGRAEPRLYTW